MKKTLLSLSIISILLGSISTASFASDDEKSKEPRGFYSAFGIGSTIGGNYKISDKYEPLIPGQKADAKAGGATYSLAIGYQPFFIDFGRFEVEYLRVQSGVKSEHSTTAVNQGVMLNIYMQMPTWELSPYLGFGIGMLETDITDKDMGLSLSSNQSTGYQGILGLEFEFPFLGRLGLEGRYLHYKANNIGVQSNVFTVMAKIRF